MKFAVATAIVFAVGVLPGLAGYQGRPPAPWRPAVAARKAAPVKPQPRLSIALVLEKLRQRLEHEAPSTSPAPARDG